MDHNEFDESAPLEQRIAAAQHGNVDAMFSLAHAYRTGDQVPESYVEALRWLRQAAEQGHPAAQNDLGSMYLNGMATAKDVEEATLWYTQAAKQGQPDAQFNLALRYLHGDGAPLNPETVVRWLCQAIEHGHTEATGQLGTLLRFGQGIPRNIVSAAELHVIAAMDGDVTSMGNLMDYRHEIEDAALAGSVLAALCLAKLYDRGITVPRNKAHAWAWLQWARRYGLLDNDAEVVEELRSWMTFEEMFITADIEQESDTLLAEMAQRAERLHGALAQPAGSS